MGNYCANTNETDSPNKPEEYMAKFNRSEVSKHNTPEDCWIVID